MNWADIGILIIVALSIMIGLMRGFIREAFGLGSWVLAVIACIVFGDVVGQALQEQIPSPLVRLGVAYGGLFLVGLLVGGIITAIMVSRIRDSRFSIVDRMMGTGLGMIRGILIVGFVVLIARTAGVSQEGWWAESKMLPPFSMVADGIEVLVPESWLEPLRPEPVDDSDPVIEKDRLSDGQMPPELAPSRPEFQPPPDRRH